MEEVEAKENRRAGILEIEEVLKNTEGAILGDSSVCPLKHSFSDKIYVREIFIPKDMYLTGKIHKHDHPNFLMEGEVAVITEEGKEILKAPQSIISPPGTKRALYSITDLVWITVHHNPTNTRDLKELEKIVIADSYDDYDRFISHKKTFKHKLKDILIKRLLS